MILSQSYYIVNIDVLAFVQKACRPIPGAVCKLIKLHEIFILYLHLWNIHIQKIIIHIIRRNIVRYKKNIQASSSWNDCIHRFWYSLCIQRVPLVENCITRFFLHRGLVRQNIHASYTGDMVIKHIHVHTLAK